MTFSRGTKCFVVFLSVGVAFSVVPLNFGEVVKADTTVDREGEFPSNDCLYRSVENNCFSAEENITAQWYGHSNIDITFINTGDEIIHDWYFTFDFDYEIENSYNCYIVEHDNNLYTIGNNDWNQDINPGQSVTVGFTAASRDGSEIKTLPSFYLLNTETVTLTEEELSYSYEEYSNWSSGFNGALILSNNTNNQIRDWTITFNSNKPIMQVDSAILSTGTKNTYTITNDGYNQNISEGQTYRIELQGGENNPVIKFELTDLSVTSKQLALNLDDDRNENGIVDVLETVFTGTASTTPTFTVTPTTIVTNTPMISVTAAPSSTSTPTNTITPKVTATPVITTPSTPVVSGTSTPTTTSAPTVTVTPTSVPTVYPAYMNYLDSDLDGLPDVVEDVFGTDKDNEDTDCDGVNDYFEIILSTDPLDFNSGRNSDYDQDGITNIEEIELGTDPTRRDSDYDGLPDYEEVYAFKTDPLQYDTDDDGMSDYSEVNLGSDPIVPDSDVERFQTLEFEPSSSSDLSGVTKVKISGYISGSIDENTCIMDIYDKDPHTASIEALVGDPVNIETTGEFSTMTITFEYSDGLNENNLRIMWYDEENCEYVVLNNYSINKSRNTISVTTDHFSKYMLIDEEVWVLTWFDAMSEASMSALGNSHSAAGYISNMNRKYDDKDGDGLVDVLEMTGMIDNIGHVIYTNPNEYDTDNDDLSDCFEMGMIGLTEEIFERSPFYKYVDAWQATYGYRPDEHVFFKMSSNPTKFSSDSDTLGDGVDADPLTAQQSVIYILYQDDDGVNERDAHKYAETYRKNGLNCVLYSFSGKDSFVSVWDRLGKRQISLTQFSQDEYYNISDVVISAHGDPVYHSFFLSGNDLFIPSCVDKNSLPSYNCLKADELTPKKIENLHLRICYSSNDSVTAISDIPSDFLLSFEDISNVYAFDSGVSVWNTSFGYSLICSYGFDDLPLSVGYGQVVYHRGDYCAGIVGIGCRLYGNIMISYDNLYNMDMAYTVEEEETTYIYEFPWECQQPFDPILDRV